MTPAELSAAVRAAVQAAVDAGELAVPVPESVKVERPKVREHGDYATSVALQLAKPAGRPPREVAEAVADPAARRRRRRLGRRRRARLPQHHPRLGRPGRAGPHRRDCRRRLRRQRRQRRAPLQPGVRLGQPDRAAAPRPRPVGRRRRRPRPDPRGHRRRRRARVLLQRRRRADRPVRAVAARRGQGRADTTGRLRRRVHRRDRRAGRAAAPRRRSTCGDDEATALFRARGHGADVRRDPAVAGRLRRALRRLLQREGPARQGRAGRRPQAAHRRRPRLRAGRRDLAAYDHVRRRQGPRPGQGRRRAGPTSPPTPPTTSTSASAASTRS